MRRLLLTALLSALVVGLFAGVASARRSDDTVKPVRQAAPFRVSASMPSADAAHPGLWGYASSGEIARAMGGGAPTPSTDGTSTGGAGATVTVTATVLPVVMIVVDKSGRTTSLFTNTDGREPRGVLFTVRTGSIDGPARRLNPRIWSNAQQALGSARAGTGTIWSD